MFRNPGPANIAILGGIPRLSAPTLDQASAMSSATAPAGMRNPPPAGEGLQIKLMICG